jgi:serine/threonine protein kinase
MSDWNPRANDLFLSALEHVDEADRLAFLDKACGDDFALRRAVEEMLAAYAKAGSFLARPAILDQASCGIDAGRNRAAGLPHTTNEPREQTQPPAQSAPTADRSAPAEKSGSRVGPYKLLQQIGEGGMGTVFMAEQTEPVRRLVALKVIKPGMNSHQVIARFEAERQALALMDHPNIAKVLDAGTTDAGHPFFVMELVKGVPITKYCDDRRLTPQQRLELFVPVCNAVQHAHQKGIIHRDLKPSNVLIAQYDGKPVPKVIDFGVAKATGQKLTDKTLFTDFGAVVGTLEYMSPEQAELNQLDIDTRSDIYSLGVMLYELLTGTTPLDRKRLRSAAILECLRLIREEEPPRPSTRLSTTEELPSIAAMRSLEPKKLSGVVRGDLDWIVMKCLEKDRNRRYETANGLAADVQHYLADEPVEACPPSAIHRLRRFGRRNRAILGTAALVSGALVVGLVVALWQAIEADTAAKNAQANESSALAAKASLDEANKELMKKQDEVEATLARSLLRPLARQPGPLTELEVESLWELAGSPGETLWKRFLEQALQDPATTRSLKIRAEPALHAAVGLSPKKRLEVEQLLVERMLDPKVADAHRGDLALIAVALGDLTPLAQKQVIQALIETLATEIDRTTSRELTKGVSTLAAQLDSKEAERICAKAAALFYQGSTKKTDIAIDTMAECLSTLAVHMERREAVRLCSKAAAFLTKTTFPTKTTPSNPGFLSSFSQSMVFLAPYIERDQVTQAGAAAAKSMTPFSRANKSIEAIVALAPRMEPTEAAHVWSQAATIITLVPRSPFFRRAGLSELEWWVEDIKTLGPRLSTKDAAQVTASLIEELIKSIHSPDEFRQLTLALAAVVPRLESTETRRIAAVFSQEMKKSKSTSELLLLLDGLDAIALYIDPQEIASLCDPAAYSYISDTSRLSRSFSAAAIRMKPEDASIVLLRVMAKAKKVYELPAYAEALCQVGPRMEPDHARRDYSQAAAIIIEAMANAKDPEHEMHDYVGALSRVAARMDPKEATRHCSRAAAILSRAMGKEAYVYFMAPAALSIGPHLGDKDARDLYSQAIASVLKASEKEEVSLSGGVDTAAALSLLVAHMDAMEASRAANIVNRNLAIQWNRRSPSAPGLFLTGGALKALSRALFVIAGQLERKEAAFVCAQAAEILNEALAFAPDNGLAMALAELAARLDKEDAARVCARAAVNLNSMHQNWYLGRGLSALADHMEPRAAVRTCSQTAAGVMRAFAMAKTDSTPDNSARSLSIVLARFDPREQAHRSSTVVSAIGLMESSYPLFTAPVFLKKALEPLPCRLSPQELVDLLKHPTCIVHSRRIILDQLESHYHRRFADQWAFVRFAMDQKLDLDLKPLAPQAQ